LDIENTEFSPGARRMHALVGQEAPFDHGRQQMKVLASLAGVYCGLGRQISKSFFLWSL
jgi:hypothetical protein